MKKEVVVLDADERQRENLKTLLENHKFKITPISTLTDLNGFVEKCDCRAVILNLDNVLVNNKILREIKRKNPTISIIALSKRQFHPELEESLRKYISACLAKPVDPDELVFWLKSVFEDNNGTC
jgi:DNA-binding NtrC family response regulator